MFYPLRKIISVLTQDLLYLSCTTRIHIQVVQGHSPFKCLLPRHVYICSFTCLIFGFSLLTPSFNCYFSFPCRYESELIIAVGKGEPSLVMSEYGFK